MASAGFKVGESTMDGYFAKLKNNELLFAQIETRGRKGKLVLIQEHVIVGFMIWSIEKDEPLQQAQIITFVNECWELYLNLLM